MPEAGDTPPGDDVPVEKTRTGLTRPMLYTLIGAASVVAIGLVVSLSFLASGSALTGGGNAGTPVPTVTQGPLPSATPVDGSEVQAPETGTTPDTGQDGLPPLDPAEPLIAAPFPASAAADGALVDGFPADILGPVAGSDILSSSIATEGGVMQVTLVGRTDAAPADVTAALRARWAGLGLSDSDPSSADALTYTNPFTTLSSAFTPASSTGTVYMLFGVFRTS